MYVITKQRFDLEQEQRSNTVKERIFFQMAGESKKEEGKKRRDSLWESVILEEIINEIRVRNIEISVLFCIKF